MGKITKDGEEENKFYYMKDHLAGIRPFGRSIRAVINEDNTVVSAQDYDMWGYLMENRTFNIDEAKYKFTGKERDIESSYDYFGARYYMSRVGRWGGVEPLMDEFIAYSPYNYCKLNPIRNIDIEGEEPFDLKPREGFSYADVLKIEKDAQQEIGDRTAKGINLVFSGDIEGAVLNGIDNLRATFTTTTFIDAIPNALGLDFVNPIGYAKIITKVSSLPKASNVGKFKSEKVKLAFEQIVDFLGEGAFQKEIKTKMSYLMQKGFTHSKAQSLSSGNFRTIKVKDIENLCLVFNCTPNELFTYIPEKANPLPADSALNTLLRSPVPDVSSVLNDVTIQEASELLNQIQKLKKEK